MVARIQSGRDTLCGGCCTDAGCRFDRLGCPGRWPTAVTFAFAGLVVDVGCQSCCAFSPTPADCLNRTFNVLHDPAYDGPSGLLDCVVRYRAACVNTSAPFRTDLSVGVDIVADTAARTVTVYLSVQVEYSNSTDAGWSCCISHDYQATYDFDAFPCDGPWTLDAVGDIGAGCDCPVNWPASVTVSGAGSGSNSICCDIPVDVDCGPVPPPPPCPAPPCGDGIIGDGGGVVTGCCAKGDELPQSLQIDIIPSPGCPCLGTAGGALPLTFGLAWSNALGVWTGGSNTDCGKFVRAYFFCTNGVFSLRLTCEGALLVSIDGDYGVTRGCEAIDIFWTLNSAVNACCDLAGGFFVRVYKP